MKRTQVYFDEAEWGRLQARARAAGQSAAAMARDAVAEYLARAPHEDDDPILRLVGDIEARWSSGPQTDGAASHDHHLYGRPKEGEPWPRQDD